MNFLETKLKQTSPSHPPRRTSDAPKLKTEDTYNDDTNPGAVDENVITAFVRKSAVMGIKKLVSEGSLLQVKFCEKLI